MRNCGIKDQKKEGWLPGYKFHQWGYGSEEGANGDPNIMWSIAIVEAPNGEILELSPSSIWFTDSPIRPTGGG